MVCSIKSTILFISGGTPGLQSATSTIEHGGGYAYRDSARLDAITRNRYIYWLVNSFVTFNPVFNLIKMQFQMFPCYW